MARFNDGLNLRQRLLMFPPLAASAEPIPPVDPNGLALWVAKDAVSSLGTVTIPNRIAGGSPWTSSTATILPTAIEGRAPGISGGGSGNVDLSTRTELTVYIGVYGGTTAARYLWAHGTALTRARAIINQGNPGAVANLIRTSMIASGGGETFHIAAPLNGAAIASPSIYCFVFSTTGAIPARNVAQEVDNPRVDGDQMSIIDYGQVAQGGVFSNAAFNVAQDTSGANTYDGVWGCCYVRHGAHTIAERRTWTAYLQYFMGTYGLKEIQFSTHSVILGASGLTGGFRSRCYTSYLADVGRNYSFRYVGEFPVTRSFTQDYCYAASGWTMDDLAVYMPSRLGPEDSTQSIGGNKWFPDIIFLAGVSNDLFAMAGTTPADYAAVQAKVASFIAAVRTVRPSTLFVISTELTRTDIPTRIATWNSTYAPLVVSNAISSGAKAILDTTLGDVPGTVLDGGGVHPTEAGYDYIASVMYPRFPIWAAAA